MGLALLVIFVLGSLFLSLLAWRGYDSLPPQESDRPTDRPVLVISIGAIVFYSVLPELLAHFTKLSFVRRIVVAGAATLLVQFVAYRILNRIRQKA